MSYYYVKHTGSSTTNGGTTKQSGAFSGLSAAAVYGSIADAITYGATNSDIICVSDAHSKNNGSTTLTYAGPTSGDFLYITTVDDSNCDTETKATTKQEYTLSDINFGNSARLYFKGIYFEAGDDYQALGSSNLIYDNCTKDVTGISDQLFRVIGDGACMTHINTDNDGISGVGYVGNGSELKVFGGSITGVTDGLLVDAFLNGGGLAEFRGVAIPDLTGTFFKDFGANAMNDDTINIIMHGCQLNASYTAFTNEEFESYNQRLTVTQCGTTATNSEYQFYIQAYGGTVEQQDDAGIHRDESTAFPSGTKVSAYISTNTSASIAAPFYFELPARYAELSSASTDTLRLYLASTTTLYDVDVWAEAVYPDGTNKHIYTYLSNKNTNMLSSGTELTDDTVSTWKNGASDLTGYNEYQIDLDTSSDAGADGIPIIRIYVAKPSINIYLDTTIDVVA